MSRLLLNYELVVIIIITLPFLRQVQDWRSIQTMVQNSEEIFSRIWRKWKAKVYSQLEWELAEKRDHINHTHHKFEETLSPGSMVQLAIHKNSQPLRVYKISRAWVLSFWAFIW